MTFIVVALLLVVYVVTIRHKPAGVWFRSEDRGYHLFRVGGVPRRCRIEKRNAKTAWVRLRNGDRIKRHLTKHGVAGVVDA